MLNGSLLSYYIMLYSIVLNMHSDTKCAYHEIGTTENMTIDSYQMRSTKSLLQILIFMEIVEIKIATPNLRG
jgi:hypothetical protein